MFTPHHQAVAFPAADGFALNAASCRMQDDKTLFNPHGYEEAGSEQFPLTLSTQPAPSPLPASENRRRVLLVDDHPIFRHGVCQLLEEVGEVAVCGEAENAQLAIEAMRRLEPELVLLDVNLPGTNGIELLKLMLAERPRLMVLMLSMHDESLYALRALRAGARGYVMKHQALETLLIALRRVIAGGIYISPQFSEKLVFKVIQGSASDLGSPVDKLSDRELEVLQLFGRGKTTPEIAEALHRSVKTVETHRAHILKKLGFKSADELMVFAAEWMTAMED